MSEISPGRANQFLEQPVPESSGAGIWRQAIAKLEASGDCTAFLRLLVAEIPWGHNLLILNKFADPAARLWYLRATARLGWSRNVLLNQIKAGSYERAITEPKGPRLLTCAPFPLAESSRRGGCNLALEDVDPLGVDAVL